MTLVWGGGGGKGCSPAHIFTQHSVLWIGFTWGYDAGISLWPTLIPKVIYDSQTKSTYVYDKVVQKNQIDKLSHNNENTHTLCTWSSDLIASFLPEIQLMNTKNESKWLKNSKEKKQYWWNKREQLNATLYILGMAGSFLAFFWGHVLQKLFWLCICFFSEMQGAKKFERKKKCSR